MVWKPCHKCLCRIKEHLMLKNYAQIDRGGRGRGEGWGGGGGGRGYLIGFENIFF